MNASKDYYLILEVHPQASAEMIERAKRLLLQRYHPDHNPSKKEWAAEQTRQVLEAYQVLSVAESRADYDRERRTASASRPRPEPPPGPSPNRRTAGQRPQEPERGYEVYRSEARSASRPGARADRPRRGPRHTAQQPAGPAKPKKPRDPLPDGVRVVECQHCGRPSRVPKGADLYRMRCGACHHRIQLRARTRLRNVLAGADDRLEQAKRSLRRFLFRKGASDAPSPRPIKEKTSR